MADHPSNRVTKDTLDDVFTYHPPHGDQPGRYVAILKAGRHMAEVILSACPSCADTAAAVRKVREAVMTANAAIALVPEPDQSSGSTSAAGD